MGRIGRTTRIARWAAAALLLASAPAWAKEPAKDKARPPVVDPRADAVLREMGQLLAQSKQFSFHAEITFEDMLPSQQMIQLAAMQDVAVRRPDRAYVEYAGDLGLKRLWYDGKHITLLDATENVWAAAKVPGNLDGALRTLFETYRFQPPLADFLFSDPYELLKERAQLGAYLGLHDAAGVRCHHLAFVDKTIDWQIWVEDGAQPVPRKVVITYKLLPGSPRFEAVLSEWNLDQRFGDLLFTPQIPPGATQIDFATVKREVEGR